MSSPFRQFTSQLALGWERSRVRETIAYLSVANDFYLRYLYYQMFGINACFWFKRRQVSSYKKDPELGPGYTYVVAWDSYCEYLRRFTNQEEVCNLYSVLGLC